MLQEGGRWDVVAKDASRVALLKAIRNAFGLSLEEAIEKSHIFPIVYQGTKTEAEWLSAQLREASIDASVVPSTK
jgi:ribosomal protein L7/L12